MDPYRLPYRRHARSGPGRSLLWIGVAAVVAGLVGYAIDGRLGQMVTDGDRAQWIAAIWLRGGTLLACWAGLAAHGSVFRGRFRRVWATLPVQPARVVREELRALLGPAILGWAVVGAALSPTWWYGSAAAWGLGVVGSAGALLASIVWSARALLRAVSIAEDPAWTGLLDRVRGANPRPQAAVVWALAPVVLGIGLTMVGVSEASGGLASGGEPVGAWWGLLPWGVAWWGWRGLDASAREGWYRGTTVIEEIRSRYAAVERPEDARRVPLDGLANRLPEPLRSWALLELRHGWRSERGHVNAAWGVALVGVVLGWTDDPRGVVQAAGVTAMVGLVPGRVPVLAAASEARWLRRWLKGTPWRRGLARGGAVLAWSAGPCVLVSVAVFVRSGAMGLWVMAAGVGGASVASVASVAWAARRSVAGYTASASIFAALIGAVVAGRGLG